MEAPDAEKLCRDLCRYSAILSQTTTEERVSAIEEAAELSAG